MSDSPLSLRDIDEICEAFSDILKGVYHERIEYPNVKHYVTVPPAAPASAEEKPADAAVPAEREEPPAPAKESAESASEPEPAANDTAANENREVSNEN